MLDSFIGVLLLCLGQLASLGDVRFELLDARFVLDQVRKELGTFVDQSVELRASSNTKGSGRTLAVSSLGAASILRPR